MGYTQTMSCETKMTKHEILNQNINFAIKLSTKDIFVYGLSLVVDGRSQG